MHHAHSFLAPLTEIAAPIQKYWDREYDDVKILSILKEENLFDTEKYGLGIRKFRAYRTELGLVRARTANFTVNDIVNDMIDLRQRHPHAGYLRMKRELRARGKEVKRSVIQEYMHRYEPDLVRRRIRRRLKCRRFWAAGVNDVWCLDQHDKLKRYGLALHICVDPFTGKFKWLRVWWTNSNPRLIFGYYLDRVKKDGYIPLVTQSDPGPENFCIAKGHSFIRQSLDSQLQGTLQHRYMKEKNNLPPEIAWSGLRRDCVPGLEDILANPHVDYSCDNPPQYNVFKWVAIPWFQSELDAYAKLHNSTKRRAQCNKILPHGPPDDIEEHPHRYNALDFKVSMNCTSILEVY
ncbi:hypothetical protein K435DRAFT_899425 [Dendrothele bispora CBS 962.96]|uniref:Integrase core domain-containing protein n=1 Tax=Dendrothele bispora (strain CBS 962.96) TaxID=1314807 RepID=A0A4S8LYT0_DENBC|nr:hypothetical protein K435DRAFT_899425 [Dendrothele bispora CBS 962.96]